MYTVLGSAPGNNTFEREGKQDQEKKMRNYAFAVKALAPPTGSSAAEVVLKGYSKLGREYQF